jgi:predicted nucleotidyltransferase
MRLPSDLAGDALAAKLCRNHGYALVRQTELHIRLTSTYQWTEHQLTLPRYDFLNLGTLHEILGDVADHLRVDRNSLAEQLLGEQVLATRKPPLRREQALAILAQRREQLQTEYGVQSLAVFGSVARDEARADSDVDLLVEFNRPTGLFGLAELQRHLEELLGRKVDLVTFDALRPEMKQGILDEAIRAA